MVQEDANPGSEPAVNDDGSLSVYISDENSDSYFASRIRAGAVGAAGTVINDAGHGDMSPSLSGDSDFTVAAWIRLFEDLKKADGEALTAAEQKQLLNSTEIMVATTNNQGTSWDVKQLTENASPDLAPVTASNGTSAVVFWRSAYASDPENLLNFDTQNAIYYSRYNGSMWSEPKMAYNGSIAAWWACRLPCFPMAQLWRPLPWTATLTTRFPPTTRWPTGSLVRTMRWATW